MALSEQNYREMLESYRDIDEDKILAGLTDEELQQLEVGLFNIFLLLYLEVIFFFNRARLIEKF